MKLILFLYPREIGKLVFLAAVFVVLVLVTLKLCFNVLNKDTVKH